MASLHNNMISHSFNNYSDADLINAVRHGDDIQISDGCWNILKMSRSSLIGVFPTTVNYNRFSFNCKGVKEYQQSNLVMIKYGIRFQDNTNWEIAQTKFQDFLHTKLRIPKSSVIIEGIVSDTDSCYIMRSTEELMKALINVGIKPEIGLISSKDLTVGGAVAAAAVALFLYLKLTR